MFILIDNKLLYCFDYRYLLNHNVFISVLILELSYYNDFIVFQCFLLNNVFIAFFVLLI